MKYMVPVDHTLRLSANPITIPASMSIGVPGSSKKVAAVADPSSKKRLCRILG
jgi:hypothetical protein